MAGNARFEIKLDRITKGALTIIKNLNTLIMTMTSRAGVSKFRLKLGIVVTFQEIEL